MKAHRNHEYERKRNQLIPKAEKVAYEHTGQRPKKVSEEENKKWADSWNQVFHKTMNELAIKAGLV